MMWCRIVSQLVNQGIAALMQAQAQQQQLQGEAAEAKAAEQPPAAAGRTAREAALAYYRNYNEKNMWVGQRVLSGRLTDQPVETCGLRFVFPLLCRTAILELIAEDCVCE
jgi:hypothetical protein